MYCSIDKIDLLTPGAAIQTDHRAYEEIEAEPELSSLYAMARILNARGHLVEDGRSDDAVHYVIPGDVPPSLCDALTAVGATIERMGRAPHVLGPVSSDAIDAIADRAFSDLARRAASRVGSRDLAIALRMLEDQTFADPPDRTDEPAYWQRVLELAALAGELLRAKYPHAIGWVQTDRAMVPFGFGIDPSTVMFPTNRAQRVIEDGADESLFKLLLAAEETMRESSPDVRNGRLMPSLRDRRSVELDEIVWRSVLSEAGPAELPIVVCGIDGENTFGMIRREAIESLDEAMERALVNLAAEPVEIEDARIGELRLVVVSGSFYAAEKILDRALVQRVHDRLDAELLAAAVPTRGVVIFTPALLEPAQMARFAALVATRFEEGGGRAISPAILLLREGRIAGFVHDERNDRADTAPIRAETQPDAPKRPGLLRRLFGRK